MYVPVLISRRDDVAGGPVLHAENYCTKARRAPSARSGARRPVPQDQIHHVGLAVEHIVEARAEDDARADAVPVCTARSAVAHARRHVAVLRRAGGSILRRTPGHRRQPSKRQTVATTGLIPV
jgi:hypothetical protein